MLLGGTASAQQERPSPVQKKSTTFQRSPSESRNDADLDLVRQLIRRRSYISAANLLEDMFSRDSANPRVVDLLLDCYFQLKAYSKAELLLERQIENFPFAFIYYNRLLEVYLKTNADSLVNEHIETSLEKFPGDEGIYRVLIDGLIKYGYNKRALDLINKGREQFSNPQLFAMESAQIHETRGEYEDAAREYMHIYQNDTTRSRLAERKMSSLIRYPGADEKLVPFFKQLSDSLPDNEFALKFLEEAYILSERFEEAFDITVRLDSVKSTQGSEIFSYMRRCRERRLYQQVIEAGEYIEQRDYKRMPFADYKFYYAEALTKVGRLNEAIAMYDTIVTEYPRKHDKGHALIAIGNIYHYQLSDYELARKYYDSVYNWFNNIPRLRHNARLEIGRILLIEGDLQGAENVFEYLNGNASTEEEKEMAAFNLAMIELYRKNYEDADLMFRRLISQYPRGFYVNDALITSLIIEESAGQYEPALDKFSEAVYFDVRQMPDSVKNRLNGIIELGRTPLAGPAHYRLAKIHLAYQDTAAAMTIINNMESEYKDDYFFPYCYKIKGDIKLEKGDREEAKAIYTDILENYPAYPLVGEVRRILREMEKLAPAS